MHFHTEEELAVLNDLRSRGRILVLEKDLKKPASQVLRRLGRDGHILMTMSGSNRFGGGTTIYTFRPREAASSNSGDLPMEEKGSAT